MTHQENMVDDLETHIELKELELTYPYTESINLHNGESNSSDEYLFNIGPAEYRKLEQLRGDYFFEFRDNEYPCSILDLTRRQVKMKIEALQESGIENGRIKVDMSNIIERERAGLCQLREENNLPKKLLLFGNDNILGGAQTECEFENVNLNSDQKQAIKYAVGVRDVYLIWGPPGTGKTTIVPEIVSNYIRLHLEDNQKILVCSYTNKAVDNVVKKLFDNDRFRNSIVRFGDSTLTGQYKNARFDEQLKKKREEIERNFNEIIQQLQQEKEEINRQIEQNKNGVGGLEKEIEAIKSEISTLKADMTRITEQITTKEHSLLKNRLETDIVSINKAFLESQEILRDIQIKKDTINKEIKKHENQVSKSKKDVTDTAKQLDNEEKNENDTANIIRIIEYYLDFANGPKKESEALRTEKRHIKEEIVKKERSLLNTQFSEEITKLSEELKDCRENLKELYQEKAEINKGLDRIDTEISRLNGDISGIGESLDALRRNESELDNITHLLKDYLEFVKKNKIVAFLDKHVFRQRNLLYERYRQELSELQLAGRNRKELVSLLNEKTEEQNKVREKITRLQNELRALERKKNEDEEALERKEEELMAAEENYLSLNGNIERTETRLEELRRDVDLLDRNELKYDEETLRRGDHELSVLSEDLSEKKDKIKTIWTNFVRGRQNLPYEQYKSEITELQLARRNREELEIILQERLEEWKKVQKIITKLQSDLNTRECALTEKEEELTREKEELNSIERSHANLSRDIENEKTNLEELKRNAVLLERGELEYDKDALRREDQELDEFDNKLSNNQNSINREEDNLKDFEQKRSSLIGKIEQLEQLVEGTENKIQNVNEKMQQMVEEAKLTILKEKRIIATTNLRACDKLFNDFMFDLVIMDEAGAIDLPGAVIPILQGNKTILLGDHHQLPPILSAKRQEIRDFIDTHQELLGKSIFEKLFEKLCKGDYEDKQIIMLKSQYRMKTEIADFISHTFYNDELNTPIEIKESLCSCPDDIISNRYPMICFSRRFWTDYNENRSAYSLYEIKFIKNIIERFKKKMPGANIVEDIAIISPYRAQTDRIIDEIPGIDCGTVHTFQGQEKRIVIFATANYRMDGNGGFGYLLGGEKSKNLLNVAVSRAQEKFIIIGCKDLFKEMGMYKRLYQHIRDVGYVAPAHITDYDIENYCYECGDHIPQKFKFCKDCWRLHRLKTFLDKRPREYRAVDGHDLRSTHEMLIDNWFYENGIKHKTEKQVPANKLMYCDWFLPREEIYVEYWGLMHEKLYREARKVKEKMYSQANLTLRSIEPKDMKDLYERLPKIFSDVLRGRWLFNWENVPGSDNEKLLRFLRDDLNTNWAENAEILKSTDEKTIRIFKDEHSTELIMTENEETVTLRLEDGRTYDLKVRREDGRLNIYKS